MTRFWLILTLPLGLLVLLLITAVRVAGTLLPDGGVLRYQITDAQSPGFVAMELDVLRGVSRPFEPTHVRDGTWSPDGRLYGYLANDQMLRMTGEQGPLAIPAYNRLPVFSWDGSRLAIQQGYSLWVRGITPASALLVTGIAGRGMLEALEWSPDGQRLAMYQQRRDGRVLLVAEALSTELSVWHTRALLTSPAVNVSPYLRWSADGQWLYYAANLGAGFELGRIHVETDERQTITGGYVEIGTFALSPDQRHAAFVVVPEVDDTAPRRPIVPFVYLVDLESGATRNLTADVQISVTLGNTLALAGWTPDSRFVIVHLYRGGIVETRLIDRETADVRLFDGFFLRWSPDGTQIAYLYAVGGDISRAQLCLRPAGALLLDRPRQCLTPAGRQIGEFVWRR